MDDIGFTSREAARVSGVPFFTVDYWDRSKFLKPSLAASRGRGKGRGRRYSYGDALRLRIARELREQNVSLRTLRHVIQRLERVGDRLVDAEYVYIGRTVKVAADFDGIVAMLRAGAGTMAIVLDVRDIRRGVAERVAKLRQPGRAPAGSRLIRD
jgi:DNA-binding transcriptional MerR regulator